MDEVGRILVVDDTPHNVKLLRDILGARGHDVTTAENGAEALEHLSQADFDLVLLDVVMPKMTGFEVCRRIRRSQRTALLPVVLVTALSGEDERLEGIEAGG